MLAKVLEQKLPTGSQEKTGVEGLKSKQIENRGCFFL